MLKLSEVRQVTGLPNKDDNFANVAWKVAYHQWWRKGRGADARKDMGRFVDSDTQFTLESILTSPIYEKCVEYLMATTRTQSGFERWVESFSDMGKTFGTRMGLAPERVTWIVKQVRISHEVAKDMADASKVAN